MPTWKPRSSSVACFTLEGQEPRLLSCALHLTLRQDKIEPQPSAIQLPNDSPLLRCQSKKQPRAAVDNDAWVAWPGDQGADPNGRCELDFTPLSCAVISGSIAVVDMLFHHGGDARKGQLMYHAIERQPLDRSILDMLVEKEAPIDHILYSSSEQTQLEYQISALGLGTPLHAATAAGNLEAVRYLIDKGASAKKTTLHGRTALQIALDTNACKDIVDLLRNIE
nr:isoform 3 of ankyrin repeat and socs box protein 11 [Quercus suber]